jgi:hypothetical protein
MYVVMYNKDVIEFEEGVTARTSRNGDLVHIIDKDQQIVGSVPMRVVRFFGPKLPKVYQQCLDEQNERGRLNDMQEPKE